MASSKTMEVKILRTTVASGERVEKDKTYELNEDDAKYLVALKKAEFVDKKPEKPAQN